MPKILYSPGYGAGWISWAHTDNPAVLKFMATYPPFIEALERGEKISEELQNQFEIDFAAKFPKENLPYMGGVEQLCVTKVHGPFRVEEYDGSERVIETYQDWIVL